MDRRLRKSLEVRGRYFNALLISRRTASGTDARRSVDLGVGGCHLHERRRVAPMSPPGRCPDSAAVRDHRRRLEPGMGESTRERVLREIAPLWPGIRWHYSRRNDARSPLSGTKVYVRLRRMWCSCLMTTRLCIPTVQPRSCVCTRQTVAARLWGSTRRTWPDPRMRRLGAKWVRPLSLRPPRTMAMSRVGYGAGYGRPLVNADSQNEKHPAVGQCCGCGSGHNTIFPAQDRKVGSFDRLLAQMIEVTAVDRITF
jgi:hypothetical protein